MNLKYHQCSKIAEDEKIKVKAYLFDHVHYLSVFNFQLISKIERIDKISSNNWVRKLASRQEEIVFF